MQKTLTTIVVDRINFRKFKFLTKIIAGNKWQNRSKDLLLHDRISGFDVINHSGRNVALFLVMGTTDYNLTGAACHQFSTK